MMRIDFFKQPKEVQEVALKNIFAGFGGNILFPLVFYMLTDIEKVHPRFFYGFISFTLSISIFHFWLGSSFLTAKKLLGERGWNLSYLVTLFIQSFFYTIFCVYTLSTKGLMVTDYFIGVIVWAIAFETFARFCSAFIETYYIALIGLYFPMVISLIGHGIEGLTLMIFLTVYAAYSVYNTKISHHIFHNLVNARKTSEENSQKIHYFMNLIPAMIIQFNHNFEVLMLNKQFSSTVNLKESDLKHSLDKRVYEKCVEFMKSSRENIQFEIQVSFDQSKNKDEKWYKFLLSRAKNNVITMIAYDIHEQKMNEIELEQQRISSIASSKLASLGEMAGGIAHEINNPLTIIMGHNRMIKKCLETKQFESPILKNSIDKIEKLTLKISKIIQGMKNLSRQDDDDLEVFYVKEAIEDALSLSGEKMKNAAIDFQIEPFAKDLKVHCNKQQISQVALNLLNNAFDIIKSQKEKIIRLRILENQDKLYFDFIDNGSGVNDESKLFQPFYTTKPVGEGTGLGLSISKKIIEKNKGDLIYFREDNRTVFRFTLPKAS